MKTLTKITLTAMMIIILTNATTASNFKMFRMYLSEGKSIEVFSKVESIVEENLPVIHNILKGQRQQVANQRISMPVKQEEPVQEDIVTLSVKTSSPTEIVPLALVSKLSQPEQEVNDLNFDTREVFENYRAEKHHELTPRELSKLVKKEQEVKEDPAFQSLMQVVSK